jgi:hypothetical protein
MSENATPAGLSGRRLDRVRPTGDIEPATEEIDDLPVAERAISP